MSTAVTFSRGLFFVSRHLAWLAPSLFKRIPKERTVNSLISRGRCRDGTPFNRRPRVLMLARADEEGRLVWARIRQAIGALQAPPSGTVVPIPNPSRPRLGSRGFDRKAAAFTRLASSPRHSPYRIVCCHRFVERGSIISPIGESKGTAPAPRSRLKVRGYFR